MKKIKLWLLAAATCMVLTACGNNSGNQPGILEPETITKESTTSSPESPAASSDTVQTSSEALPESTDDSVPPKEGMVRSRLTNEWVDSDVAYMRPIAVMTPNESAAIPHYNLSQASIIYEANVEGRMTRMLAIYEGWDKLDKIGNIRSLRAYYAYWALEWDAFIVHFGGPFFVDEVLAKPDVQDIDGNKGADDSAFFRTNDRKRPHNAYANGANLKTLIEKKNFSLNYRGLSDEEHYVFASKANPNTLDQYTDAKSALKIDMSSCYPLTRCYFEYNEEDGLYYRFQHLSGSTEGPHIDAVNGEQLTFKNILVQYTKYEELGDGYLAFQCHDSTRDGWFFTNGKGIHVNWEKTTDFGATRYYDDNGNEITLNTGKTMVLIVEEGDSFTFN